MSISCNSSNAVMKVENSMAVSVHNCHVSYRPLWWHGWVGAVAAATQPHRRVSGPVSLAQEEAKFKTESTVFNTYCFPTIIKLKNHKLNHDGSGTDCIHSCFWMPWSSVTYSQKKKRKKKWRRVKGKHVGSLNPSEGTPAREKVREG